MKRTLTILIAVQIAIAGHAAETPPTIAVVDFTASRPTTLVLQVPDLLEERLVNSGLFTVVEREKLNSLLLEQGYQTSGGVDPATIEGLGAQLGARYLLTGKIVDVGNEQRTFNGYGTSGRSNLIRLTVNVKVIDLGNGKVAASYTENAQDTLFENGHLAVDDTAAYLTVAGRVADQVLQRLRTAPFLREQNAADAGCVTLFVGSVPEGADVEIDGVFCGNAGQEFTVEPGLHEIIVSLPGHNVWAKKVLCRDGMKFTATLERQSDLDVNVSLENREFIQSELPPGIAE